MKTLAAIVVLTTLASPAFAGVIPIDGNYCERGTDVILTSSGIASAHLASCPFGKLLLSGPNWWTVMEQCNDDPPTIATVILKGPTTIVFTDHPEIIGPKPLTLHRCK